jgi:hypothetical protein
VLNLLRCGSARRIGLGTVIASSTVSFVALYMLFEGKLVIRFSRTWTFAGLGDHRHVPLRSPPVSGHRDSPA